MKTGSRLPVLALAALIVFAVACGQSATPAPTEAPAATSTVAPTDPPPAPTNTPAPTATPAPTDTPAPTATPAPTNTPAPTATPDGQYSTEFDDPAELALWPGFRVDPENIQIIEGEAAKVTSEITDGAFRVDIRREVAWMYYIFQPLQVADIRLEVEAVNQGRNNNNVSLICRYSDAGWYEFNIANNGLYWIFRYDTDGLGYVELASGGATSINMGQGVNVYSAVCDGDQLALFINGGKAIKTVTDRNLKEGQVGFSVSSFNVTPIILEFTYFKASAP